jgi:hypothetical protein
MATSEEKSTFSLYNCAVRPHPHPHPTAVGTERGASGEKMARINVNGVFG